ncbi:MAG: restriction endonuclease subunit S [Deltaproteobacteria bacterium]|nr:restriction endonuclease subunit S [Deltaproteobacteria bacterium]
MRNLSGCQVYKVADIPNDWDCVPLKERIEFAYGKALHEEDRKVGTFDVYGSNGKVGKHSQCLVDAPGILVGRKGTVGAVHYADQPFWPIDTVYFIRTVAKDNFRYIFHVLNYLPLQKLNAATGVPGLSRRDAYALRGAFPLPKEQEAIARVLDTMGTIVERLREAVKRAGDLRKALIQASFSFELCSEPLMDTEYGRIPRTWEWVKGKKTFVILSGGTNESSIRFPKNQIESDAWFMKVDDFNNPANRRSIAHTKIGFQTAANPKIKLLPSGTVIIAKRGAAILKNRVRTSIVPLVLDPNLMGIQMCDDIMPDFFAYQLEWMNLSRFLEDSGIPQLNNKDLYPRHFLRAPEDEQKKIVSVIKTSESHENALLHQLDTSETLKLALMHDLLTGKVRVNHAIDQILSLEAS